MTNYLKSLLFLLCLSTQANAAPLSPEQLSFVAKKIKLIIVNAEGILLNDQRIISPLGDISVIFNAKDANAIQLAGEYGIRVIIISKESLAAIKFWGKYTGAAEVYNGIQDTRALLGRLKAESQTSDKGIAFISDDLEELTTMKSLGLLCTSQDAPDLVKADSQYISKVKAGDGVLADVLNTILEAASK